MPPHTMLWRLKEVRYSGGRDQRDGQGNIMLGSAKTGEASVVVFRPAHQLGYRRTLIVYRSADGWVAYDNGSNAGHNATPLRTQDFWADLFAQAVATVALTGNVDKFPAREII